MSRLIDATELNGYKFGLISPYAQKLFHDIINNTPTVNAIIIPEGATNGDVIKALFPNEEIVDTDGACVYYGTKMRFDKDLWNASYMKEVKE